MAAAVGHDDPINAPAGAQGGDGRGQGWPLVQNGNDYRENHLPADMRRRNSGVLGAEEGSLASCRRSRSRSSWPSTSYHGLISTVFIPNWSSLAVVAAS